MQSDDSIGYFERVTRSYCSLPADSGRKDSAILALAERSDLSRPTLLLDYGCGQGRLLGALSESRAARDLANLRYIGVDSHNASLADARDFFRSAIAPSGAIGCFVPREKFRDNRFLVDQVVLVFTVHELSVENLADDLAGLWRMLRRGGCMYIQDTSAPIHDEVEFIAFTPEQICSLLSPLGSKTTVSTTVAGRRRLPVFLVEARKPSSLSCDEAYSYCDLGSKCRDVLHRSLLTDCLGLLKARVAIERSEEVDANDVAAVCHRLAVRARAFHHTLAIDKVNARRAEYCIVCGSEDVEVEWPPWIVKDPEELSIRCRACGNEHTSGREHGWNSEVSITEGLFTFLDEGIDPERVGPPAEWRLEECLCPCHADLRDVLIPFLRWIPGVSQDVLQRLIERYRQIEGPHG